MRPEDFKAEFGRLCETHLGADLGPRVAALTRRGFTLIPVADGEQPSGRFRFGGPALLEPGTPWPTSEGTPMPLLAVMDTEALAPWLDVALPRGAGLLNVFYVGHEDDLEGEVDASERVQFEAPLDWRVVPADPASAVETPPPPGGVLLPPRPVRADPIVTLPNSAHHHGASPPVEANDARAWEAFDELRERFPGITVLSEDAEDEPNEDGHRAFGWPWDMQGGPVSDESRVHLLQLDTDGGWTWADCGMISLDIPAEALRAGDFGQVDCYMASC